MKKKLENLEFVSVKKWATNGLAQIMIRRISVSKCCGCMANRMNVKMIIHAKNPYI